MRAWGALLLLALVDSSAAQGELRQNPFNDPFAQATAGMPCPAPRGPAYDAAEIRQEEHSRVERGTTCWLNGLCKEPNAYRYDKPNAEAALKLLRDAPELAGTSIWIIAERRFIYLQGCVATADQAARAEALMHMLPDVQIVIPMMALPGEEPRYPLAVKTQ